MMAPVPAISWNGSCLWKLTLNTNTVTLCGGNILSCHLGWNSGSTLLVLFSVIFADINFHHFVRFVLRKWWRRRKQYVMFLHEGEGAGGRRRKLPETANHFSTLFKKMCCNCLKLLIAMRHINTSDHSPTHAVVSEHTFLKSTEYAWSGSRMGRSRRGGRTDMKTTCTITVVNSYHPPWAPPLFEKYLVCREQVTSCLSMLESHCYKYASLASAALHSAYFLVY